MLIIVKYYDSLCRDELLGGARRALTVATRYNRSYKCQNIFYTQYTLAQKFVTLPKLL